MLTSRLRRRPALLWTLGLGALVVAVVVIARSVEVGHLRAAWDGALDDPVGLAAVGLGLFAAFAVRAWLWHRTVPSLSTGHALAAIGLSFGANHLLPFRLGEGARPLSVSRRAGVPVDVALASTLTLRAADLLSMVVIGLVIGPGIFVGLVGAWGWFVVAGMVAAVLTGVVWLARIRSTREVELRLPGPAVAVGSLLAWCLEAVVVWKVATWAGVELGYTEALLVTVAAVSAQIVAVAPGGIGTYEAAATAALVATGVSPGPALAVAVAAHAVKTAWSLVGMLPAACWPAPSLLGPLRVPSAIPARQPAPVGDGPVVLVLPARNEAGRVGGVIERLPSEVAGRPTRCIVVDDGSSDSTILEARASGAEVVRHGSGRGLGAAVRTGLAVAVERGAAVVAFCDADGEYDPAELEAVVRPILDGAADYVVGSRFAGRIDRMLPQRRIGNVVLTRWVRWMCRLPVTDGQSGFRALSARAAAEARIAHDYNYAQVLTVELVQRGFTYAEVPIHYRFRDGGRSFVKLGRYLRQVVPATLALLGSGAVVDVTASGPLGTRGDPVESSAALGAE